MSEISKIVPDKIKKPAIIAVGALMLTACNEAGATTVPYENVNEGEAPSQQNNGELGTADAVDIHNPENNVVHINEGQMVPGGANAESGVVEEESPQPEVPSQPQENNVGSVETESYIEALNEPTVRAKNFDKNSDQHAAAMQFARQWLIDNRQDYGAVDFSMEIEDGKKGYFLWTHYRVREDGTYEHHHGISFLVSPDGTVSYRGI